VGLKGQLKPCGSGKPFHIHILQGPGSVLTTRPPSSFFSFPPFPPSPWHTGPAVPPSEKQCACSWVNPVPIKTAAQLCDSAACQGNRLAPDGANGRRDWSFPSSALLPCPSCWRSPICMWSPSHWCQLGECHVPSAALRGAAPTLPSFRSDP